MTDPVPPPGSVPGAETAADRPAVQPSAAAGAAPAETLDRLTRLLSMAGLRLLSLRARLERPEDQIALIQASEILDEAIAEMRRLALASRLTREGR